MWPLNYKKPELDIILFDAKTTDFINKTMRETMDQAADAFLKGNRFNSCKLISSEGIEIASASDNSERKMETIKHCVMELMKNYGKKGIFSINFSFGFC